MENKQRYSLYLTKWQAQRFDAVFDHAYQRARGRVGYSEVMQELMGYPLPKGMEALLTPEDRAIISAPIDERIHTDATTPIRPFKKMKNGR